MHITKYAEIVGHLAAIDTQLATVNMHVNLKTAELYMEPDNEKVFEELAALQDQFIKMHMERTDLEIQKIGALLEGLTSEPLEQVKADQTLICPN